MESSLRKWRIAGAVWAIVGISILLFTAFTRLMPHILDAFLLGLTPFQWIVLAAWVCYMLVTEGYQGFQKNLSPRVAARMWHLVNHGRRRDLILAPIFCLGYYGSSRKRLITTWTLTIGIIFIIFVVSHFADPWRGIVDVGVVLGLGYGLLWIYIYVWRTIRNRTYVADPVI